MAIQDVDHGDRDGAEAWPELYQELGRLPERFRRPILLCHLEGLTYQQAAERLGCPVRTVQSRLARGARAAARPAGPPRRGAGDRGPDRSPDPRRRQRRPSPRAGSMRR